MNLTTTDLDRGYPESAHPVHQSFENARKAYATAEDDFGGVSDKIRTRQAWDGAGVDDADTVMETNVLALAASRTISESAWLLMDALGLALENAQKKYRKIVTEASQYSLTINEDGSVIFKEAQDRGIPNGLVDEEQEAETRRKANAHKDEIERKVKGCLAYASIADKGCATQLNALAALTPITTATADKNALAASRAALTGALGARETASLTQQFWQDAKPKAVPDGWDGKDTEAVVGDVITVAGSAAGVVAGLAGSTTGLGAILGIPAAAASAKGAKDGLEKLVDDVDAADDDDVKYKPVPPGSDPKELVKSYENSENLIDKEQAQGFSSDSDSPGAPTEDDHKYSQYTDIGTRDDAEEELIVDESTGDIYYSDDGGDSYVKIKDVNH